MRISCLLLLATLYMPVLSGIASAQEGGRPETVRTPDGLAIHMTYYPFSAGQGAASDAGRNAPVVILLHGSDENRQFWDQSSAPRNEDPFPVRLQKNGYAVITVDLRKHGESSLPGAANTIRTQDYDAMVVGDLAAVKRFLFEEHQNQKLNMNKLGIVAVGMSAPIAMAFAEMDWRLIPYDDAALPAERTPRGQDVRTLVLISPDNTAGRIHATRSTTFLRSPMFNIAFQVIVGSDDNKDKGQAEKLYTTFMSANKGTERAELLTPKFSNRGSVLMTNPVVYQSVSKFLDNHLKNVNSTWQDRRSRLER